MEGVLSERSTDSSPPYRRLGFPCLGCFSTLQYLHLSGASWSTIFSTINSCTPPRCYQQYRQRGVSNQGNRITNATVTTANGCPLALIMRCCRKKTSFTYCLVQTEQGLTSRMKDTWIPHFPLVVGIAFCQMLQHSRESRNEKRKEV